MKKGKEWEDIEPLNLTLDTRLLPIPPWYLGFRNPEKCFLTIKGGELVQVGNEMKGGKIIIEGNNGAMIGKRMESGEIRVKGDCRGVGSEMKGGEVTIEEYCGGADHASKMKGGKIIFQGGVENIDDSAFTENNRGEIWVRGERIWPMIIPLDELRRR